MKRHLKKRYIPVVVAVIEGMVILITTYVNDEENLYIDKSRNVYIIEGDIKKDSSDLSFLEQ